MYRNRDRIPVTRNNLPSESVVYRSVHSTFQKLFPEIALHHVDERLLSDGDENDDRRRREEKRRRDKAMKDRISASIILQSWLSRKN
jgi:RNase H-fold protein (predicted Holliday junction resolvase)